MREHCKTQHKYDPDPTVESKSIGSPQKTGELSETSRARFKSMMTESLLLRELAYGSAINESIWDRIKTADSAVNYMLNNYVIVQKRQIQGISGYTCNNCLTFHFRYIKDIGYDLTAGERHRCLVNRVTEAESLQDRGARQRQLHKESVRWLVKLSKSVFGLRKAVVVRSTSPETFESTDFHAPLIELDFTDSSHWTWRPIHEHRLILNEKEVEEIMSHVGGTFAVISIKTGEFKGHHLLKIARDKAVTKSVLRGTRI
jgi:hypothetical protein